jgi:hypothetical protein
MGALLTEEPQRNVLWSSLQNTKKYPFFAKPDICPLLFYLPDHKQETTVFRARPSEEGRMSWLNP